MKKSVLLVCCVLLIVFAVACGEEPAQGKEPEHIHTWTDATCTESKMCSDCGVTEGSANGHNWKEATCTAPMTCDVCNATEGHIKEHEWVDATYELPKTCKMCGKTEGEPKDIFAENDLPEVAKMKYDEDMYEFSKYFTVEEFISLYKTAQKSLAEPRFAVNESLFIAHQHLATYNSTADKYMLMDINGNIIRDYGDNSWPTEITRFMKIGEYAFVPTLGNPATFEIIDQNGTLISTFKPGESNYYVEYVQDLGNDFHMFAVFLGGYLAPYLINPKGECQRILWTGKAEPYSFNDLIKSLEKGEIKIGKISEDMFYIIYSKYIDSETYAFYFNQSGEKVIDLSSEKTNFHIYEMGDFNKGEAEIRFRGADLKYYSAVINAAGEFLGDPIVIKK